MWVECPECYNLFNVSEQLSSFYILTPTRFFFLMFIALAVGIFIGWGIRHYGHTSEE